MKTVLITGANRGIGLEFARQYASAGARLISCCRSPENATDLKKLQSEYPDTVTLQELDVSNFEAIDALAKEFERQSLDLLINNAGVYFDKQDAPGFDGLDYDKWLLSFRVNTLAPVKMTQAFFEHLKNGTQKTVAMLSSKMGSVSENQRGTSVQYRSSKAALNAATRTLSIDLAPEGLKFIVLHPGWVQTDMGGGAAPLLAPESVKGMISVIEGLSTENSGSFVSYDGQNISW